PCCARASPCCAGCTTSCAAPGLCSTPCRWACRTTSSRRSPRARASCAWAPRSSASVSGPHRPRPLRPDARLRASGLQPAGSSMKITFLGGGNMATALIGGMLERGFAAADLQVVELGEAARGALEQRFGVRAVETFDDATLACDVLVLAVKPQQMKAALAP